jgi:glutamate-1-semialdehyde aminotransferase/acyl carrier protein
MSAKGGSVATAIMIDRSSRLAATPRLASICWVVRIWMTRQASVGSVISALQEIFGQLFGIPAASVAVDAPFLELGADSLLLMQGSQAIGDRLGVKVPFRDLLGQYTNIELLAAFVHDQGGGRGLSAAEPIIDETLTGTAPLREGWESVVSRVVGTTKTSSIVTEVPDSVAAEQDVPQDDTDQTAATSGIHAVMQTQLELMAKQLELLRPAPYPAGSRRSATIAPQSKPGTTIPAGRPFIPYAPIRPRETPDFSGAAREHVAQLVSDLQQRTAESKRLASLYRPVHADNRASAGFQLAWKEIVYPIVAQRADGSRFHDVDGNEYIDITMDYGVNLFGHNPQFVTDAITQQLRRGMAVGPYNALSGPTAALVCEATGLERVAFTNSGTEAVMGALRVARAVTHRRKVVVFSGCFHGTFDGILARSSTDEKSPPGIAMPLAPGISPSALEDVIVVPYAEPVAFEIMASYADDIAAVLVEPVQSRRPHIQPAEWLRELRDFTTRIGAALIFDEIITGFRLHLGGAQSWFGIRADIVTYGKVLGGGMPIGAVAGNADFMAAIDGGVWAYGDSSWPSAETTFFAGTFWKHPLVIAAAHAVQTHLREEGPALQEGLNARTAALAARLNDLFHHEQAPINVVSFSSLFRFVFRPGVKFADLFFYNLLRRGVYVWEGRTCYLSTAHSDGDIATVVEAVEDTVKSMRSDGLMYSGS